jgi:hypothetical protein
MPTLKEGTPQDVQHALVRARKNYIPDPQLYKHPIPLYALILQELHAKGLKPPRYQSVEDIVAPVNILESYVESTVLAGLLLRIEELEKQVSYLQNPPHVGTIHELLECTRVLTENYGSLKGAVEWLISKYQQKKKPRVKQPSKR